MAALDNLPSEMLVQIFSSLGTRDLAQTSLVSRRFSAVCEPLLYQSPILAVTQTNQRPSLKRFIETLINSSRRTLGTHVRSVTVEWDRSSRRDASAYLESISPFSLHDLSHFHGIHIVHLLHLLPAVRVLQITPPRDLPHISRGYISHCLEAPHGSPTVPTMQLQSLRKFICPHATYHEHGPRSTTHGGITFDAVLALMKLPCIESIDTHMTDIPAVLPPGFSNDIPFSLITSLRISVINVSPLTLSVLLRAPVALRRFSFVAVAYSAFSMSEFAGALSPLQGSLEFLHLDLIRSYISFSTPRELSLHSWAALHTLRCSTLGLLGYAPANDNPSPVLAEVLPRSLRRLEIAMDQYWLFGYAADRVVELLLAKEEVVPLLQSVAMGVWPHARDGLAWARLGAACENAGVQLVVHDSFVW